MNAFTVDAIGTAWRVDSDAELDSATRRGILELTEEYDADYSLTPKEPAGAAPRWEDGFEWEANVLTARTPVLLDVGAAGKGQLVDLVAGFLASAGHDDVLVDASGDMLHRGSHPLTVALEHPYDPTSAIGTVPLGNRSLCA